MYTSFIIPAYNVSDTIVRCLDSIYSLPLRSDDFEVIAVDDCSTDNTVEIIKGYQTKKKNLTLLCQPRNHRLGAVRNVGVNKAKGDYIVFVDSDDEVQSGLPEALKMAAYLDLDMVALRYSITGEGGTQGAQPESLPYAHDTVFRGRDFQIEHPFWAVTAWCYVYRTSFMRKVNYRFAEDVFYEDADFVNVHLYFANRMAYCNIPAYNYHLTPGSISRSLSYYNLADYAYLGQRMLAFYESLPDKASRLADIILEGGSYNIMQSFRKLFMLHSPAEVPAFYDRLDSLCDRHRLLVYKEPAYCWTLWTKFGLRHRLLTTAIVSAGIMFLRLKKK